GRRAPALSFNAGGRRLGRARFHDSSRMRTKQMGNPREDRPLVYRSSEPARKNNWRRRRAGRKTGGFGPGDRRLTTRRAGAVNRRVMRADVGISPAVLRYQGADALARLKNPRARKALARGLLDSKLHPPRRASIYSRSTAA